MTRKEKFLGDGHYVGAEKSLIKYSEDMTKEIGHVRSIIERVF